MLSASVISEDGCHIEVDTSKEQGFVTDSSVTSQFALSPDTPVDCVWMLHAPVGSRVSRKSHACFLFSIMRQQTNIF